MYYKKRFPGFQIKILISYAIFLVVFIIFSLLYWSILLFAEQKMIKIESINMLTEQANNYTDDMILDVNATLYMHNHNDSIKNVLKKSNQQIHENFERDMETMKLIEYGVIQKSSYIAAITYIGINGTAYTSYNSIIDYLGDYNNYIVLADRQNGRPYIGTPFSGVVNGDRIKLLPISKTLIDAVSGRSLGYIVLYINLSDFCDTLDQNTRVYEEYYTLILNHSGLIYKTNTNNKIIENEFNSMDDLLVLLNTREDKSHIYESQSGELLLSSLINRRTGWHIIKYTMSNIQYTDQIITILTYLSVSIICLFLLLAIGYFYSKRISKGIYKLHNAICLTRVNDLKEVSVEHISNDEIGDLMLAYNKMIRTLNDSIQKEYIAKLSEQKMRIQMLNFQINPHFLYNCLNLVSSIALLHNVPEVSSIAKIMGSMFQYSIDGTEFVKLDDELKQAERYIAIQSIRFQNLFEITWFIEPATRDMRCVKFIIQPVLENCFKHGFHGNLSKIFHITISVEQNNNNIEIIITDNGKGITDDKLHALNHSLNFDFNLSAKVDAIKIGLSNVNNRLKNYFGLSYGIKIESVVDEYTRVLIKIPVIDEEMARYECFDN